MLKPHVEEMTDRALIAHESMDGSQVSSLFCSINNRIEFNKQIIKK